MSNLSAEQQELLQRARQFAMDLERHARIESSQGHLSPTDLALFGRVMNFLRYDIAQAMTGDPEHLWEEHNEFRG